MVCGKQFQHQLNRKRIEKKIWHEYIYQRQTITQLALQYGRSKNWIRNRIANASVNHRQSIPQPVVLVADATFFQRTFGICVMRSPHLKKNLSVQEIQHEAIDVYRQGRVALERQGYTIQAVVLDGRRGVRQLFADIPVQMCHFHQKQIITRYLTNNPKLEAGMELKKITATLCKTNESDFASVLDDWYERWALFLKEKTIDPVTLKWHYTHKRLRSAYRSLRANLPYLFTYQKHPELAIPNTTNSLDGCFAYLKELTRIHRGATKTLRRKIIEEVLWR